jgi:hypothetical protein
LVCVDPFVVIAVVIVSLSIAIVTTWDSQAMIGSINSVLSSMPASAQNAVRIPHSAMISHLTFSYRQQQQKAARSQPQARLR